MLRPIAFLSSPPRVELVRSFARSFDVAVATARTCYSPRGVISAEEVAGVGQPEEQAAERRERRDRLARDLYAAGHHTTFQHGHFQFALSNVSRHFLWSFLHSHPFYNSEQVSQRYVTVREGSYAIPPLDGAALDAYRGTADGLMEDYRRLARLLHPLVEEVFFERFPSRRHQPAKWAKEIEKRCQEVARYVLPVATFAYLYHTISALTLFRYFRLVNLYDTPLEQRLVIGAMVERVLAEEPAYRAVLEEPMPLEATPEWKAFQASGAGSFSDGRTSAAFRREFDEALEGRTSRLVDWKAANEGTVAQSVREVLGAPRAALSDEDALAMALDPARNAYFGESLNLLTVSKLGRCLAHAAYTFRKKLSHTADSQDQRHRMTPASRPVLAAQIDEQGDPDVVRPAILGLDDAVRAEFDSAFARAWEGAARLRRLGVSAEFAHYLLPNAVAIRFTESSDLLHLHHKHTMRLCWNAQEEIWRASLDEAEEIRRVNPAIGKWLLPPCTQRARAGVKPPCPEGARYCGVPVWRISAEDWRRTG